MIGSAEDIDFDPDVFVPTRSLTRGYASKDVAGATIPLDGGASPISALLSYNLGELQSTTKGPALWGSRADWKGRSVRAYTAAVARVFEEVNKSNEGKRPKEWEVLMALGGASSSGILKILDAHNERTISGVQLPPIFSSEGLALFEPEVLEREGVPHSVTVPGAASIDSVNAWLKVHHPGYELYFDITTSNCSTIAANFFTGGLGDNRLALDVESLVVVDPDSTVRTITDPQEIEALRGTQGYACMGTEFTLRLRKVPKKEEQAIVDLNGATHAEAYKDSFVRLFTLLYPYLTQRGEEDIWVDGVEVMDESGMATVLRSQHGEGKLSGSAEMADRLLKEFDGRSVAAIMLRVRHNFSGTLNEAASDGNEKAQAFVGLLKGNSCPEEQLIRLVEEAIGEELRGVSSSEKLVEISACVGDLQGFLSEPQFAEFVRLTVLAQAQASDPSQAAFLRKLRFVSDAKQIADWRALRADIPDRRRKEGEKLASGSNDREFIFKIETEGGEPPSLEAIQAGVAEAVKAIMVVVLAVADEAKDDCYVMWNGHLDAVQSELVKGGYYDGGGNLHLALTAKSSSASKATINQHLMKLSADLSSLHGKKFGPVRIEIQEGEKHYPPIGEKMVHEFVHFVLNNQEEAISRMVAVLRGGETVLNFRAPNYEQILRENDLENVWELVQERLSVQASTCLEGSGVVRGFQEGAEASVPAK